MKKVIVVYTNRKLTPIEYQGMKPYVFNTNSNLKIGDMISSPKYDNPMQIIGVMEASVPQIVEVADFINKGRFNQYSVRELVENIPDPSFIYFKKL